MSYDDFAERTKKHGQRRVFEAPPVTLGNDQEGPMDGEMHLNVPGN